MGMITSVWQRNKLTVTDPNENNGGNSKVLKSVNLQYDTMGQWAKGLGNQASDVPSMNFFHNFLQNSLHKSLHFFNFFITLQKYEYIVLSALSL